MANEDGSAMTTASNEMTELRGPCPKDTVDLLDAFSVARGLSRTQLVIEILGEWARMRRHEITIASRVLRSKPVDSGFGGLGR